MNSLGIISAICFRLLSSKTQFLAAVNDFSDNLFGSSFLFVLTLFAGVFLLFILSAAVSHLFKLDKFYENSVRR